VRVFIGIAAVFGVAFVFITPPLQVPDEAAHYWRSCAIAHGTFQPKAQFGHGYTAILVGERELGFIGGQPMKTFRSIPFVPERVIIRYPLSLSPLPFIPQAMGIAIGNALQLRPLYSFYLGRLFNLACALALVALSGAVAPSPPRLIIATCALLPMTLFMFASFSPDAMTIAMAFLATSLAIAGSPWIIAATIGVALCKPYLLIPLVALAGRRRWIGAATLVTVIAGAVLSSSFAKTSATFMRGFVDEKAQIANIQHNPLHALAVVLGDLANHGANYMRQMVGTLGWLTVPLPDVVILAVVALLIVVALFAGVRLTVAQRVLALIVAIASIVTVELSEYIAWTAANANIVEGVQGRYFIPILPLLAIAISRPSTPKRWLPIAIAVVMIIANSVALFALWQHYVAA